MVKHPPRVLYKLTKNNSNNSKNDNEKNGSTRIHEYTLPKLKYYEHIKQQQKTTKNHQFSSVCDQIYTEMDNIYILCMYLLLVVHHFQAPMLLVSLVNLSDHPLRQRDFKSPLYTYKDMLPTRKSVPRSSRQLDHTKTS